MGKLEFVEAEHREFFSFYTIYKLQKYQIWFPASLQNSIDLYCKFFKQNAYWLEQDGQRVGGIAMEPNWFGLSFLIPPYQDEYKFIKTVVRRAQSISVPGKPLLAFGMVPDTVNLLQQFGFQILKTEKEMICAARPYELSFPASVRQGIFKKEDLGEMITLYHDVFSKSQVQSLAQKPYEFYENLLKDQVDDINPQYSTLLRDSETGELVGSCTAQIWYGLPSILDIVVKHTHQRMGLAEMMIKNVLNEAYRNHYPGVCLTVVCGNSAEHLYHKLGFLGAVTSSQLKLNI